MPLYSKLYTYHEPVRKILFFTSRTLLVVLQMFQKIIVQLNLASLLFFSINLNGSDKDRKYNQAKYLPPYSLIIMKAWTLFHA